MTTAPLILIKYATRGRPTAFQEAIKNIETTISKDANYCILVSADMDDQQMNTMVIRGFLRSRPHVIIHYGNSKNKIEAINAGMDVASPNWNILINMSDDMRWIMPGWDRIIASLTTERWPDGDWFAHFDDGAVGEKLATMSIMDRKYYERDKYIYHPSYRSFSCDAEAMYVAMMRGRHHYFDAPKLFLHQHPAYMTSTNDETYRVNSRHTPHDTTVYWERLNKYFDIPEAERVGGVPFQGYVGKGPVG